MKSYEIIWNCISLKSFEEVALHVRNRFRRRSAALSASKSVTPLRRALRRRPVQNGLRKRWAEARQRLRPNVFSYLLSTK